MEINLITDAIELNIKKELNKLLQKKIKAITIDTFYPSKIIEYLRELGVDDNFDNFECNGWDYDYWIYFNYNNERYCLSGSGYYGGLTIGLDD